MNGSLNKWYNLYKRIQDNTPNDLIVHIELSVTVDAAQYFDTISSQENITSGIFPKSGLDDIRYLICSNVEIKIWYISIKWI